VEDKLILAGKSITEKFKEIQELYLKDSLPWVIGFSGGKDSTTILQLIWEAVQQLPKEKRQKIIYVISTDTLVESPILYKYITRVHEDLRKAAKKDSMPFEIINLKPKTTDTFWVNIIGRGYPAPTKMFRWCTNRLKIKPSDRFIFDKVSQFGEAFLVLGLRKEESATRAQSIKSHKIENSTLSRHAEYPQIIVYTPIEDFKTEDIWKYLLSNKSPWGSDNGELFQMYTDGSFSECAFAIDTSTKTCGGTRFGCWTCTLVSVDKITENQIALGQEWMKSLSEIRKLLYETTLPENKAKVREFKGRLGNIRFKSNGTDEISRGPYTFAFSKELLAKILTAQKEIENKYNIKDFKIIRPEELLEIRKIWISERGDWADSLPIIYHNIFGEPLDIPTDDLGGLGGLDREALSKISQDTQAPYQLLTKLIEAEYQSQGMKRRASIYSKIDRILGEEWRSEEEVISERKKRSSK